MKLEADEVKYYQKELPGPQKCLLVEAGSNPGRWGWGRALIENC